jgi:hypothetical protein
MAGNNEDRNYDSSSGDQIRILGTDPENPEEGRIFIWTKMGWFERIEGAMGDVAFIPVAKSQDELNELIARDNPSFDLNPLSPKYRKSIADEFMEQSTSSWGTEDSDEETVEESEDNDQQYHQHDL